MEEKEFNMTHGLIALDRRQVEGESDTDPSVLHFCGYESKPSQDDINALYLELKVKKEFGLNEIFEHIVVYDAPEEVIEHFRGDVKNMTKHE